jgi:hypothetical protein
MSNSKIKTIHVDNPDKCLKGWKKHNRIGKGSYGDVYEACSPEGDCEWVLKISEISNDIEYEVAANDSLWHSKLNNYAWAVKMHSSWF